MDADYPACAHYWRGSLQPYHAQAKALQKDIAFLNSSVQRKLHLDNIALKLQGFC